MQPASGRTELRMTINPALDAQLDRRGVEAVKELLALSAPLPTAELVGLAGPDGKGINRRYVEGWLGRKAEEQRRREVSNSRWIKIGVWVAIATVGVALAAWWFPR
jgi:hypothetical protein